MTIKELQLINRTIKAETLRFCRGMAPSLDEIASLAIVLASKTRSNPCQGWIDVVGNTIIGIIDNDILA